MTTSDNIVLVTGASSGIGKAIAIELGRTGYIVVVNYRSNEKGANETFDWIVANGGRALKLKADVTSFAETEKMFELIENEIGFVTHLVNNAGTISDGPLMLLSQEQWHSVINTNLNGTFICSQLAMRGMIHSGKGSIVNIVSPSGIRGPACQCNYSAAKGGVIAFPLALARETGRYQIRVNAVSPGIIETSMTSELIEKHGQRLLKEIPLTRFGQPQDVSPLVAYLLSDRADYITGQIISVDGGLV